MTILLIGKRRNNRTDCLSLQKTGYTLIELILLTLIIAILIGVSTPLFRKTFRNLELRESAYNLARIIKFAQEKSIIKAIPYKLIINPGESSYYLLKFSNEKKRFIRSKERFGKKFYFPRSIKVKAKQRELIFYPDGHSDKGEVLLVTKDRILKLKIKGSLGYVEIE